VSGVNAPPLPSDLKFQCEMPLRPNAIAAHHRFRENSRPAQVFGIGRIEPFLDGGHQKPAIGCAFRDDFLRQLKPAGERSREVSKLWGTKSLQW
jgi:hypothetical protein